MPFTVGWGQKKIHGNGKFGKIMVKVLQYYHGDWGRLRNSNTMGSGKLVVINTAAVIPGTAVPVMLQITVFQQMHHKPSK